MHNPLASHGPLAGFLAVLAAVGCGGSDAHRHVPDEDAGRDAGNGAAIVDASNGAGGTKGEGGAGGGGRSAPEAGLRDASSAGRTATDAALQDASIDPGPTADLDAAVACDAGPIGSRVVIDFDPLDGERVTNLQWMTGGGALTANLAAAGGTPVCGDPLEYFGQAYGAEGTLPAPVVAGDRASIVRCADQATITAAAQDCNAVAQFPVTTEYKWYQGARANQLRVTRTFQFGAAGAVYAQNVMRAFVARVPLGTFSGVIYPDAAGTAVNPGTPGQCPTDCIVNPGTTWNGRWFADVDPVSGLALIVVRDPSMTARANLAINNDGLSGSNITSFLVLQPDAGWDQPQVEIEYLCFADSTTWPQTERDAGRLPAGCGD